MARNRDAAAISLRVRDTEVCYERDRLMLHRSLVARTHSQTTDGRSKLIVDRERKVMQGVKYNCAVSKELHSTLYQYKIRDNSSLEHGKGKQSPP